MRYNKNVYRVIFNVKAKVTMDLNANSYLEADSIAWNKYEDSSTEDFLSNSEITDCVIDEVYEIYN